jgi:hypothetical protein
VEGISLVNVKVLVESFSVEKAVLVEIVVNW